MKLHLPKMLLTAVLAVTTNAAMAAVDVVAGPAFEVAIATENETYNVGENATLDINGKELGNNTINLALGATLTNSGNNISQGAKQIKALTLTGNAKVEAGANKNFGMIAGGHNATTISLNGHTLTKSGAGVFFIDNTTVSGNGTIDITGGTLQISVSGSTEHTVDASGTKIQFSSAGSTLDVLKNKILKAAGLAGTDGTVQGGENSSLTLNSTGNYSFGGSVTGTLALTKEGTGTQTFTGNVNLQSLTLATDAGVSFNGTNQTISLKSTITNNGSLSFSEGAKVIISSLDDFEGTDGPADYTKRGIQDVSATRVIYKGSGGTTGLSKVYLGSDTGDAFTVTNGSIDAQKKVYVVENVGKVIVGGTTQTENLGDTAFAYFALAEKGTLQINGGLTFAGDQGSKTAADILTGTIGSGTIDVRCAVDSESSLHSDFTGSLTISNGGSVTMTGNDALKNANIKITGEGSKLVISGTQESNGALAGANITMGAGALLQRTNKHNWANVNQIKTLTLEGDATVDANCRFGVISTNARATLALGNNTLTVKASDTTATSGGFILNNAEITGTGTIKIDSSALHIGYKNGATTITGTGATIDLTDKAGTIVDKLQIEDGASKLQIAALKGGSGSAINNAGTIELGGSGEYDFAAQVKGTTGKIKVTGTGTHTYTGSSIANAINVENASGTFKFASDENQTVSGAISGAGKLSKSGAGTVTASGDISGFGGSVEVAGGTLNFTKQGGTVGLTNLTLSGGTLEVTGSLTLTNVAVSNLDSYFNLASYFDAETLSTTLARAGSLTYANVDSWSGSTYKIDGKGYTTSLSVVGNDLKLNFTLYSLDVYVTMQGTAYADGKLTLAMVDANGNLIDTAVDNYNVIGLYGDADWDKIRKMITDGKNPVPITLKGAGDLSVTGWGDTDGDPTNAGTSNVSFYGKYYGEANVGGTAGSAGYYNPNYIPEPASATLSLLALAGLAARRRRKA